MPDAAGRVCEKLISLLAVVRFGAAHGKVNARAHIAPAPVSHSFDPSLRFTLCDCCQQLLPLPFPAPRHHQSSTDPLHSFAHDRIHQYHLYTNPITLGRPPASHPTPPLCHASITPSGPLATVAAAVASIVLCYLLAIPPASAAQSADLPVCCQNPHQQSLVSSFQRQPRTSPAPTQLHTPASAPRKARTPDSRACML